MWRRRDWLTMLCCALWCAQTSHAQPETPSRHDERLSSYLEQHGLDALLGEHLERRLQRTRGDARESLSRRLVELYGRMLENAETLEERQRLERRSRDLLDVVGEASSMQLRLELSRALYERLEQIVERWRIGRATPEEIASTLESLRTIASELHDIGVRSDQEATRLQREEERSGAEARAVISQRLEDAQRRRSFAFYLAGWSNLTIAEMSGTQHTARDALVEFGWLLGAEFGKIPTLARLNAGLLHYEHVARSALGVSVCHSVLGNSADSRQWFDAIDRAQNLAPRVREQIPTWRIVILSRASAFDDLRTELERLRWDAQRREPSPLTTGQSLLVLASLERGVRRDRIRDELRRIALEDLLMRASLQEFSQSVERYSSDGLEEGGFASLCAQGLGMYYRAQERPDDARSFDMRLRASRALLDATEARDASRFISATGPVLLASGVSLRDASLWQIENRPGSTGEAARRLVEASEALARGAVQTTDPRVAGDALWLAIRCLQDAEENGATVPSDRRDVLVQMFLREHPDHPHVSSIVASQESDKDEDADALIMRLSAIGPDAPSYDTSRRKLAQLLFDQYRTASQPDIEWAGQRYADVAEPILYDDAKLALQGDRDASSRALIRGQRVLASLLGSSRVDVPRAQRVLSVLWEVHGTGLSDEDVSSTLLLREGQLAMAQDDSTRVEEVRALLVQHDDARDLLRSLDQDEFRRLVVRWRDAQRQDGAPASLLREVVRSGARVLSHTDVPWPIQRVESDASDQTLAQIALCAEATHELWIISDDREWRATSLSTHRALRDAGVTDPDVLRRLAVVAEGAGAPDEAIEAWNLIASGVERSSVDWFESRFNIIRLVASRDTEEGRALLRAHAGLYPDLAPTPWDERFRALADDLDMDLTP